MRVEILHSVTSARLVMLPIAATLQAAAAALADPHIGLVVVCDESNKAVGVISKSDIVRHLTSAGVTEAPAVNLMSQKVVACGPEDDLHVVWQEMSKRGLQNMPVLGANSKPIGVLDIRDALKALLDREKYQERLLINYVAGVGYQ